MRIVRRWVPLLLVLVVVAVVALVLTSRPDLEDASSDVDSTWDAATSALDQRYTLLADANGGVTGRPGPPGEISTEVGKSLQEWLDARESDDRNRAIDAANDLEGLGRRFVLVVSTSPTLAADPAVMDAVNAYANAAPPEELAAFSAAVRTYADERKGPVRGMVASMFGYDAIPIIALPSPT
jgi:hypothetical protein